ncbi:Type IV fimbrial biogenesis protein PilY1 [Rubrivivax sp. A210]|uniref:pilus assembly protein n=1 Tax=Rubrivivax sp. A210 TaxID=2772301 RepID=UPI00191884DF|nr:PilC/PilY family type IV pilus protein [Rubrivivax sp. A210]CAD5371833.1 Type IV fimbrial biogenesis protein PilY1 [Rubrivivax sp. A210]
MKTAIHAAATAVALTGLMFGLAAQATNLAELPLKASVLAKPNVIIGMDDSGSMGSEIMIYTNDGAFWWDYNRSSPALSGGWGTDSNHPNTALRSLTAPWFNATGGVGTQGSASWRKFVFLFPNGYSSTAGSGTRTYADVSYDHFAVMPTREFAFLRWAGVYKNANGAYQQPPADPAQSTMHNPLYYNTLVTYQPWAPAQLASGAVAPAAAASTAAKSHPVLGTSTMNLTTDVVTPLNSSSNPLANWVFMAFPGMKLPAGAKYRECDASNATTGCGSWTNVGTSDIAADSGHTTQVAVTYFPATFWIKETCTPESSSVLNDTCVDLPGGGTLKRYQIKSGNTFPSGRSYSAEMQNFANWWQYYRKRRLMLAGAMGDTMEGLTGMRLGVVPFSSLTGNVTMYDADATLASGALGRARVAGIFYEVDTSGGTPTRETLKYIGEQFKRTDKTGTAYNMIQYACQRNNAFLVTDGFANNSSVTPPAYDTGKSASNWGSDAPYAWSFSHNGVLADLALRYYTNNPRPATDTTNGMVTGALPATPTDTNTNLHINTYGLTLGARGTMFLSESSTPPTTAAAWPDPNADRSPLSVDDLWHATLNGRGKMYLANTPEETALRVRAGLDEILNQVAAQGAIAVSAVNLDRSDRQAYMGMYNPRGWAGDLTANAINTATAAVSSTANWRASTLLAARDWTTRVIFSSDASAGVDFSDANVGALVNPDTAAFPSNAAVVDYLRGSRTGEGSTFRTRSSLIGAVVNAEPVLAREETTVYLASGDGMLHAFDTVTGAEQWAYAPPDTLAKLGASVQRGWIYQTVLDAAPTYAKLSTNAKLLVGGLGAAGTSYYALDVSSPKNLDATTAAAQYRWIFPTAADTTTRAKVGYTVGQPVITRTSADGDVVLVTSGYDNGRVRGDGKGRLWVLNAATGAVIKTFRTTAGDVYPGQEAGLTHVSAFKESDGTARYAYGGDLLGNLWKFDLARTGSGELDAELLATLKDTSDNLQPVTAPPELALVGSQRVVLVGTGRLLDITDFGSSRVQTFYAIADGSTLTNARTSLSRQVYNGRVADTMTNTTFDWSSGRGWYMDLAAGEQANTAPSVVYGSVAFVTNVNGGADCSQGSYLYLLDIGTGAKVSTSSFISQTIATDATSSRVLALRVVSGRVIGTTHRSDNTVYQRELPVGQVITPAKNAWKEIRR